MEKELETNLIRIIELDSFYDVFSKLRKIDSRKTEEIENSLKQSIKDIHTTIEKSYNNITPLKLKYLLYRESVELKAHASSYLTYLEMMGRRENALWRFAFDLTEQFFDLISDALDKYFNAKLQVMLSELENSYQWYTGLQDSGKKSGCVINYSKKLLKQGLNRIGVDVLDNKEIVDAKSVVERILDSHLDINLVSKDIGNILQKAYERYRSRWEEEIKTQSPKLDRLQTFSSICGRNLDISIGFELGLAEQTFAVGISSAIVASIGLAAGWHTLTYAMLSVFPPVAIFAALATVMVSLLTKKKALENRRKQIAEALKQYHKHFLLQIEIGKIKELKDKTIRKTMNEQSEHIVKKTIQQWTKAISGNLGMQHYRMIVSAFEKHLNLIDQCINELSTASFGII